jgi:hypothetical protein
MPLESKSVPGVELSTAVDFGAVTHGPELKREHCLHSDKGSGPSVRLQQPRSGIGQGDGLKQLYGRYVGLLQDYSKDGSHDRTLEGEL